MQKDQSILFKLLIIGESGAGKSSMLLRFADNTFTESYIATIGVDFKIKTIEIDGQKVKLQVWDTAGQERFRTITSTYYRGAHGIIIVFDTTSADTFKTVSRWLTEINENADCGAIRILVGNKVDDVEHREVSKDEANEFASNCGIEYYEVSAKTGLHVDEAFCRIARLTYDRRLAQQGTEKKNEIELGQRGDTKKKKCC